MSISQIQIIVKNALPKQIMEFFIDFYLGEKSPFKPICILSNVVEHARLTDPMTSTLYNWRIAQLSENQIDASRKLAEITFSKFPIGLVLIFEFDEVYLTSIIPIISHIRDKLPKLGYKLVNLITGDGIDPIGKTRGPSKKIQDRAIEIKKIKDANIGWSRVRVAEEYNKNLDEKEEPITEDTVKNAYRAMNWEWERSDRIR